MNAQDIALDLSLKYPKGPHGNLRKKDYESRYEYCHYYKRYRHSPYVVGDSKNGKWGSHSPSSIWGAFGKDPSQYQIRCILKDAYGENNISTSSRSLSLRTRRVMQRIQELNDRLRRFGDEGVYKISWDWNSSVYLWAESKKDAQARAVVFAGLFDKGFQDPPRADFLDFGPPLKAFQLNKRDLDIEFRKIQNDIQRYESTLVEMKRKSDNHLERKSVLLEMLSDQMGE